MSPPPPPLDVMVIAGTFPTRHDPSWGVHVFQNVAALRGRCRLRVTAPVPFVPRALSRRFRPAHAHAPAEDVFEGVPVRYPRYVVIPKTARFLNGFLVAAALLPGVAREVRTRRPDVVLAYFAYPFGFAALLLARLLRIPVAISCRGSDINLMTVPRLQGALIGWALRRSDRVLVVSQAMSARVRSMGVDAARLHCVPNGVDAVAFAPRPRARARASLSLPADGEILVCVGRLSREKGIDVLLEALRRMDPRPLLVVVGDGSERAPLEALARHLELGSSVRWVGAQSHERVPDWISAADVVVLPSRHEGLPNAVLEALASGRPVVASAVGGVPELIDDPELGELVPPDDAGALAEALRRALARRWDERRIAAAALRRSWSAVGAEVADVLAAAAATGNVTPATAGLENS